MPEIKGPQRAHRNDIQGLRAIAVLAVVSDHLLAFPRGGFVGVDIFFVISGFLITGQLIRQHERTGKISFGRFYRARARRILPASALTLLVTVIFAFLIFRTPRFVSTVWDAIAATLFSSNWRFGLGGTDYWAQDDPPSPLQHFWSLGVEEQFYFVWPLVIVGVLFMAKGKTTNHRRVLGFTMTALIVASLAWSIYETANQPSLAYFSTLSRAWELGAGALLAIVAPRMANLGQLSRNIGACVGLVGIVASLAFISSDFAFPGPWALVPIAATVLLIGAGTGGTPTGSNLLSNPVMVYIGNLSYSLYLWHFPVIIFLEEFVKEWKWFYYPGVFAFMLLLAQLSYYFVEEPIRNSNWLLKSSSPKRPSQVQLGEAPKYAIFGSFVVAVVCMLSTAFVPAPVPPPSETQTASFVEDPENKQSTDPSAMPEVQKLQSVLTKSSNVQDWPDNLSPSIDDSDAEGIPDERADGCGEPKHGDTICNYDHGRDKSAVVFSDSTGIGLISTLREAIGDDYDIRGMSMAGCVSIDLAIQDDRKQHMDDCAAYKTQAIELINTLKPDLIFVTNTSGVLGQIVPGNDGKTGADAWAAATERTVNLLKPSGGQVILTTSPPIGRTPSTCATRGSQHSDCMVTPGEGYSAQLTTAKLVSDKTDAIGLNLTPLYCTESGVCPVFAGETLLRKDTIHITEQYSQKISPAFKELLETATKS